MRCLLGALLLPALVVANTEIVNFAAVAGSSAKQHARKPDWPVLHPRTTTNWSITPPAESWFVLDLPEHGPKQYTLRLSYAASSPTDFAITIFDPSDASGRRKYARISGADAGVFTPAFKPHSSRWIALFYRVYFPGFYATTPRRPDTAEVRFVLTLEPLLLGVLPASLAPLVVFIFILLVVVARAVLPRVLEGLEGVAEEARREMGEEMERLKTE
ncbi:hypothetical protein HMN09_00894700 [Mycena chlorophos]|uniref:F5/8 type C domain-containing protein n=1 Tax=Mycena chlorophos TaxID=658473 RepID=A0A8H6SPM0_MYCCL|nr:hypothetical protein HMN09_00894700 [Mycena chlorophos]